MHDLLANLEGPTSMSSPTDNSLATHHTGAGREGYATRGEH